VKEPNLTSRLEKSSAPTLQLSESIPFDRLKEWVVPADPDRMNDVFQRPALPQDLQHHASNPQFSRSFCYHFLNVSIVGEPP
jgi:hypothetical protein